MNKEEFWQTVEQNRDDLIYLVKKYHPIYKNKHAIPITAQRAEHACEQIRKEIVNEYGGDPPTTMFDYYLEQQSDKIIDLLNGVWFGMPESESVRSEPGFFTLCDLCEGYE
jgi:hypothetical protein